MPTPTRVALALGSGGARGYAHIGVIQVLEEQGFEVVAVSGSSMGALVGGLHAAGRLPAYTEWVTELTTRDVLRLLDPSMRGPGAIRGERILARVADLLEGALIEELSIPYTAVATDLLARKEVWFQRGPVAEAIRASIALPSIFPPTMLNGRMLVDGGLLNPLPLDPMASVEADLTIGVSLSGDPMAQSGRGQAVESAERRPMEEWLDRFRRSTAQVLDRDQRRALTRRLGGRGARAAEVKASAAGLEPESGPPGHATLPPSLGTFDVVELSFDAMQSLVTRYRLASHPPDLMISVPKNACRTLDFHRAGAMIELGRTLAEESLAGRERVTR